MSSSVQLYNRPSQMEPLVPERGLPPLETLAIELIQRSARLSGALHPITRSSVRELLRVMNSYYSNLIEGHRTHPIEIERALKHDFSEKPEQRMLQVESAAHIQVQKEMEAKLAGMTPEQVCSVSFLRWVHGKFYENMPPEFRRVRDPETGKENEVIPGSLREGEVQVGSHIAPAAVSLDAFLGRFQEFYGAPMNKVRRVVCAAASHHRLAWIHPFLDGNGRVTRLFTHAYLIAAGCDGDGLWTASRGLARKKDAYYSMLTWGDSPRQGDLDGRGNLSEEGLSKFCTYFLETCIDQVDFMSSLLELDTLGQRLEAYCERQAQIGTFALETKYLLREALLAGEFARGEASRLTGLPERSARDVLSAAVDLGLLTSDSPKSAVRLALPVKLSPSLFPRLFPDAVEQEIWT